MLYLIHQTKIINVSVCYTLKYCAKFNQVKHIYALKYLTFPIVKVFKVFLLDFWDTQYMIVIWPSYYTIENQNFYQTIS